MCDQNQESPDKAVTSERSVREKGTSQDFRKELQNTLAFICRRYVDVLGIKSPHGADNMTSGALKGLIDGAVDELNGKYAAQIGRSIME